MLGGYLLTAEAVFLLVGKAFVRVRSRLAAFMPCRNAPDVMSSASFRRLGRKCR
jgi:hypothetical protein